jgi:hypothetical protein
MCAIVLVLCAQTLVFSQSRAEAEDLTVQQRGWNGLSELLDLARKEATVLTPSRIDASQLDASDALLVVHPVAPLPMPQLVKFLRKGGRLAIADDFGSGRALLAAFGTGMHEPGRHPRTLRNNPQLAIATPLIGHALADGVDALVTNHTQVIYHPDLTPIFALDASAGAIVLSGAVDKGRLVAISDSSVLINNMLELPGNRTFARNLIRFLRGAELRRLYIAGSDTQWLSGIRSLTTGNPLARVSAALTQLAKPRLPALAVLALAVVLAAVLLAAAATALPRRSAYARRAYLVAPEVSAGMAGRVNYYAGRSRNFLAPLLVLKLELEHRLVAHLHASGTLVRDDVLRGLRKLGGFPEERVREVAEFLQSVDRLQDSSLVHEQEVPARRFSELTAMGRRILAELDAAPQRTHERHE